ncbi:MAG: amino acid--tRNA ligase-related protein, partial [archaeon]|nr:amino acid--tRNA ligase-related protein [archaeon]
MKRTLIKDVLEKDLSEAHLWGWIKRKRDFKGTLIWVIRDGSGEMQCVLSSGDITDKKAYASARKALMESSVKVYGIVKKEPRAPGGKEVHVTKVEVLHAGEEFPIGKDLSEEFLLDVRHLWLRSTKMQQGMKASALVFEAFHDFCKKDGYLEVQCPMFVSGAVEGGSELFEVDYFGKKAYLTQSSQFYLEVYAHALEKVYTVAPSFRAEPSRTRRHLTEFWHAEWETAFSDLEDLMAWEERMIKHVAKYVLEKGQEQLAYFGRDPKTLEKVIKSKFKHFTYDEVFAVAQKKFPDLKWGDDLQEMHEREITKDFDIPIFVHHYPTVLKPFYHRPDPKRGETVLCCDVLAPEGYGEI